MVLLAKQTETTQLKNSKPAIINNYTKGINRRHRHFGLMEKEG